ncbi:glycosyltransferase [Polymorphobacter sp. PAMC 29334]|uniref:glycosyltransferase n=1 Tax=Polymorphobacter sp. PAMC 29334 TaxID=2862331 RepID=UPI001C73EA61|nr:glycosyltransferase [Polymorphobacter sp. PAMC 29334]QYE35957.1 glycosyltransferase [Polymorphobacter sp. PAMC 29334]
MANLLVLTPRYPYPLIGGDRLRIHTICRELAKNHRLTLLSLCETREEMTAEPPDGVFATVERVYLPKWKSMANTLAALPSRTPLQIAYYRSAAFRSAVERLAPGHDAVLAHLVRTAEYAVAFPGPKILEMTDAISLNYSRVQQTGSRSLRRLIYMVEQSRLERYERAIADKFDLSVLVSEIDRKFLFGDSPGRLERTLVCSIGVDWAKLPFTANRAGTVIAFVGNMTTLQNLDAARRFATDVLPLIAQRVSGATFRVVGRINDAGRRALALPGVEVTGEVDTIAAAVRDAAIAVCPMRFGAGIQTKVLEYMALGLPTVITPIGLEGLGAVPDRDVVVADGAEASAEAVVALLRAPLHRESLAIAARRYVEDHHGWDASLRALSTRVVTLLGTH